MVLLLPTRTLALPLMMPLMSTMTGAVFFSETAAVNSARVDTVVTVPPAPPVVLSMCKWLYSLQDACFIGGDAYPPFSVANPSVALSETVAFQVGEGSSAWAGATSPAKAYRPAKVEILMLNEVACGPTIPRDWVWGLISAVDIACLTRGRTGVGIEWIPRPGRIRVSGRAHQYTGYREKSEDCAEPLCARLFGRAAEAQCGNGHVCSLASRS